MIVGPHVRMRFDVHGSEGALGWDFERMNELERFRRRATTRLHARARRPGASRLRALPAGAGMPMGYDDLRVLEAANFLAAVRDGEQRAPGPGRDGGDGARAAPRSSARPPAGAWEPI